MEKKEAIREWCIEQAAVVAAANNLARTKVDELIQDAEKLEKYITK